MKKLFIVLLALAVVGGAFANGNADSPDQMEAKPIVLKAARRRERNH